MAKSELTIPHNLGRAEALLRVQSALDAAIAALAGKIQVARGAWTEDSVDLTVRALGQTLQAILTVEEALLRFSGELPLLLTPFRQTIENYVRTRATKLLA